MDLDTLAFISLRLVVEKVRAASADLDARVALESSGDLKVANIVWVL